MLSQLIEHGHGLRMSDPAKGALSLHCMARGAGFERRFNEAYSWEGLKRGSQPFALIQHTIAGRGELDFEGTHHALTPGDTVITEAAAICAYLADLFPDKNLAPPPGSAARGAYYRWLFFAAAPLEAAFVGKLVGHLATPAQASTVGYGSYAQAMDTLEFAITQGTPYLCGDQFTAADLYLTAALGWGMYAGGIEKRPAFERYVQPIMQREAYVRATATDAALIAPHPFPG